MLGDIYKLRNDASVLSTQWQFEQASELKPKKQYCFT